MRADRQAEPPPARPRVGDGQPAQRLDTRQERRNRRLAMRMAGQAGARHRILRSIAVLPGLFTISNGLLGFAAIHLATRSPVGSSEPTMLAAAVWLLFGAMVCDMLDGRLARFTRRTSDFGGQLDSMCDIISFGVAPPVLMLRSVMSVLHEHVGGVGWLARQGEVRIERILWCVAGAYVAGAALRLARFNVENEPDESAHMEFRGLPSPGAAAAVGALVLLSEHLKNLSAGGWVFGPWLLGMDERLAPLLGGAIAFALPAVTLAVGLLMVSRFRYAHVINQYIRGKRPFNYLVKLVIVVLLMLLEPFAALAGAALAYALSGPVLAGWRRLFMPGQPPPGPPSVDDGIGSHVGPTAPDLP